MKKEALKELGQFCCTENYFSLAPLWPHVVFTDGVKFLADNADCHWLLNEVAGLQLLPEIKNDEMLRGHQFWTLASNGKGGAVLTCERDDNDIAYQHTIPFTDFPFDVMPQVRLWVAPSDIAGRRVQVIYLPSEH